MGPSTESAGFEFDVCVVGGCGHVGLPLAIVMAHSGLRVAIDDIDTRAVETVRAGRMPFMEEKAEPMLAEVINRNLTVADDPTLITRSRIVVVVIGTPVDEHLNPTFHKIHRFFVDLMPHLVDGQTLVLRSTLYPGTTEKVDTLLRVAGRSVHVAFCPERIAQGNAIRELVELPQIVAGCDEEATTTATDLFSRIAPSILQMQPIEAELTKIFANVWRYIQFATANQFFMIATDFGLDFYRIYDALTRDYPRMAGLPKSGFAAGPCLFKDTMQLAAATESRFSLGHAAMLINEGLPDFVVQQMKSRFTLGGLTVGILGMAFKGDIDDSRESLSYKLRKILEYEAATVICTDPYVEDPRFVALDEAVERSDVLILGAPHSDYRSLVIPEDKPVIDVWNFFGKGAQLT
ncbi:nucleotide sugar dehydrogenase [Mycobacterium sp. CVI_P3]|uniref:Nucleotide sugar dehydrogenase n=1 Tax=Mycobacterium pinniadriaticum TaxID=2994102 RepID=A0ABT3SMF8_9MYCO|nr:nucleotide sugar dehydrogenase [Mycobacterium pinniadriaticum]MCX2933907.1 nucleotide sugar dehydrogenase [Mycobacterium pinniadriaticum]MCX2940329.1 nucleotide sugar dehydrogenase [Mycobacterium pinniadriaticum]